MKKTKGLRLPVAGVVVALVLGLQACGGSEPAPLEQATEPKLQGLARGEGEAVGFDVTVRGSKGLPRTVAVEGGTFDATLRLLEPPYIARSGLADPITGLGYEVMAWTSEPGRVNLTPLTTLLLAQLGKQAPRAVFDALAQWQGVSYSPADIASAEDAVADYLRTYLQVEVPATLRNFTSAEWTAKAGDPMYEVLGALAQRLADRGEDLEVLSRRLGARAAACERMRVRIVIDGVGRSLCPLTVQVDPDPGDPGVERHRFDGGVDDGVLEAGIRGGSVIGLSYTMPDGRLFACTGACPGLSASPADASGVRSWSFDLALLDDQGAAVTVVGTLASAGIGGVLDEPAVCRIGRVALRFADGRETTDCMRTDEFGQGGLLGYPRGGSERYFNNTANRAGLRILEVSVDPGGLIAIAIKEVDPDTGLTTRWGCRDACIGVVLGASGPDPLGMAWRTRRLALDQVRLPRIADDGTLVDADAVTLSVELVLIEDPALSRANVFDCAGSPSTLIVTVDEDPRSYGICPAADDPEAATVRPGDGGTVVVNVRNSEFDSLTVTFASDGVPTLAVFEAPNHALRFACGRSTAGEPPCEGISLSAPDALGQRVLRLASSTLAELEVADLVVARRARLSGELTVSPPAAQAAGG